MKNDQEMMNDCYYKFSESVPFLRSTFIMPPRNSIPPFPTPQNQAVFSHPHFQKKLA